MFIIYLISLILPTTYPTYYLWPITTVPVTCWKRKSPQQSVPESLNVCGYCMLKYRQKDRRSAFKIVEWLNWISHNITCVRDFSPQFWGASQDQNYFGTTQFQCALLEFFSKTKDFFNWLLNDPNLMFSNSLPLKRHFNTMFHSLELMYVNWLLLLGKIKSVLLLRFESV